MSEFGTHLRATRQAAGLTMKKLAQASGISEQYICNIELGKRNPPRDDLIRRFSQALNVSFESLVEHISGDRATRRKSGAQRDLLINFFNKVDKRPNGCWIWKRKSFPQIWNGRRVVSARRWVYSHLHPKEDMLGLQVLTTCGNPKCINPDHLKLCSFSERNEILVKRGIVMRGEKHCCSKLTMDQVKEIREKAKGQSQRSLAAEYGVCQSTVRALIIGKTWRQPSDYKRKPDKRILFRGWDKRLMPKQREVLQQMLDNAAWRVYTQERLSDGGIVVVITADLENGEKCFKRIGPGGKVEVLEGYDGKAIGNERGNQKRAQAWR